jgi:hypothetical protein
MTSKVLNNVLDFNRMDSGRFESASEPFAFHMDMRSLLVLPRMVTDARKFDFTTELKASTIEVHLGISPFVFTVDKHSAYVHTSVHTYIYTIVTARRRSSKRDAILLRGRSICSIGGELQLRHVDGFAVGVGRAEYQLSGHTFDCVWRPRSSCCYPPNDKQRTDSLLKYLALGLRLHSIALTIICDMMPMSMFWAASFFVAVEIVYASNVAVYGSELSMTIAATDVYILACSAPRFVFT